MIRQLPDSGRQLHTLEMPANRRDRRRLNRELLGKHFVALSITVGEVEVYTGNAAAFTAGETITAGMPVYLKASDNRVWKCDANSGDIRTAVPVGISLHAALAGQPLVCQTSGVIDIGASMTLGESYFVGNTAGEIVPYGDLSSSVVTHLGIATDTTNKYLTLRFFASGVVKT